MKPLIYETDNEDAEATVLTTKRRWGFRSKNQLPLFLVWEEIWDSGKVVHATVLFSSRDWIGI